MTFAQTTGTDGSVTFSGLLPGTYNLLIAAEGYNTDTRSATVNLGVTTSVNVILTATPAPAPPATGSMKVTVSGSNGPIPAATVLFLSDPSDPEAR